MVKKYLSLILGVAMAGLLSNSLHAQGAGDVLRYSLQYPSSDPVSLVMPGASDATGFGVYQQNPASAALFDHSFFSVDLSDRYVNEDGTYLDNTSSFDDNQLNVGDIGFVYNVPAARGKLTIGAGYSQSHDFNRAFSGNARNNLSTITDFYAQQADQFVNEAAFNAFAIDSVTVNGQLQDRSIFRFPVGGGYPGINQNFEVTERGTLGEFSAFIATEFQKNLIVGASIGVITGSYTQKRDFLESDNLGDYDGTIINTESGATDIDNILSEDRIEDSFTGFSARLGAIYQFSTHFNMGVSYQFKNKLTIDEDFSTDITNTLDNGVTLTGSDAGKSKYKVTRPARLNVGITATDLAGVTISASAEKVNYSDGRIEFDSIRESSDANAINDVVRSNLKDVYNLRFGLQYNVNKQFIPRIGYGYYPSPTGDFADQNLNGDREFYSAGFSSRISENMVLNVGAQLGRWDDQASLYSTNEVTEVVTEEVNHWNIMAGINFLF